jgi:peptidoglycan L-alanyl-D-glutamate endopeptidase CwlK
LGKNVRLRFAYVYRSPEEQDALYAQGRTKPGKIITNAKAWQSIHNYGLAFDIVLLLDKDGDGKFESVSWDTMKDFDGDKIADWGKVVKYFKSKGWFWGGDWKSIPDTPHFQYDFGYTWQELNALRLKGKVIKDNGRIYPDIM